MNAAPFWQGMIYGSTTRPFPISLDKPPVHPFPIELHDSVLCNVLDRSTLISCCLTCHSWFNVCAPQLFGRIVLRTAQDVDHVAACLDSPHSLLARYAHSVIVKQQDGCYPWGHLVPLRLGKRLPRVQKLQYDSSEQWSGKAEFTIFPIHPTIPKILHGFFFEFDSLIDLRLETFRFQSFRDLLRLVGAIPSLKELECFHLTWKTAPAAPPVLTHSACQLSCVSLNFCQSHSPMAWFWTAPSKRTTRRPGQPFPGLATRDAQAAKEICEILIPSSWKERAKWELTRSNNSDTWFLTMSWIYGSSDSVVFVLRCQSKDLEATVAPQTAFIREIMIEHLFVGHRVGEYNWEKVDELVSGLEHIERLVFDWPSPIYLKDELDCPKFFEEVQRRMPRMRRVMGYHWKAVRETLQNSVRI